MSITTTKQILETHSIPYYELNGNICADSMIGGTAIFEETVNVTTWSRAELFRWLGY